MSFDHRLRDGLRQAVDGHDLHEDIALQHVKATQPIEWADMTVGALDDLTAPRLPHARTQRIVGAVAACALLAGAVALPVALRNRPRDRAPRPAGQSVTTGYRSTVTVRIGPAPSQPSTVTVSTTPRPVSVRPGNPVQLALASGTRNIALRQSDVRSNDSGIDFQATADKSGDVLSLTVIAPTGIETTTLARNWAIAFVDVRRVDARRQILRDRHNRALRITQLHTELLRVDTQLVKLAPATYKNLLRYDFPGPVAGRRTAPPPSSTSSAPEQGSVKLLNLAFERIQILSEISRIGAEGTGSISFGALLAVPGVLAAQLVSQTPAVKITAPNRDSNAPNTLIAIGVLLAGVVLATSAFLLGRRSRHLGLRRGGSR